jgi:endonuclease/exonuclease/phosphatase family metal-dependent hydrolase
MAYGTGLNGSWKQYIFKCRRFFWLPFFHMRKITSLLKTQCADVLCLVEVDGGSIRNRFRCQAKKIAEKLGFDFWFKKSKYHPKSPLRFLPFTRGNYDAVISKTKGDMKIHYLNSGLKKLVQEFIVDNISIFTVHLAVLRKNIRKMQLKELSEILKNCPRPFILCGDFNIFKGLEEISFLLSSNNLQLVKTSPTFPSIKPKKHLDLFLASQNVKIKDAGVIDVKYSDHLPVWIQMEA